MWRVAVKQNEATVHFGFNKMSDALEFVGDCVETADEGTKVTIFENKEETK